ncbi:glycoside hydrolase family 16 protein [Streptomyces sp. NBC_01221]|uniref:glycoside hydrolase family 16 protein n=1 Tax=unclassified Streptomyces TaxID=2593676 RepID=UPI002254E733|nr:MULTISPECIES: glycoside hydrolase family 16 protein [unclassified Streptomyces]MCX4790504.1 glycoside hydrolase family 16 protein [Streptomyces sp. NBC_01221]MCX4793769.1 glycoside hydrolase family 16 protein [Streptomyces sp. NBC_01242]
MSHRPSRLHIAAVLAAGAGLFTSLLTTPPASAAEDSVETQHGISAGPTPEQAFFEDFSYTGSTDPRLAERGWSIKTGTARPGDPGATWSASGVTFPTYGSRHLLQLSSSTNGTPAGTTQAQLSQQQKFFSGTYAARVRFSDAPIKDGPDGDKVVQAFFTLSPLASPMDPKYSELDYEYLPNGGWGSPGSTMYTTSWYTYQLSPWVAVNTHTELAQSYDGWHDLVIQVGDGHVKYYIDGALFADHSGKYYPRTPMAIDFNQWFIPGGLLANSTPRTYHEQVDYAYFAKDSILTPQQVHAQVVAYRKANVDYTDNVTSP